MKFCVTRGHNEQKKQRRQKNKGKMAKTRNQHVEMGYFIHLLLEGCVADVAFGGSPHDPPSPPSVLHPALGDSPPAAPVVPSARVCIRALPGKQTT